MNKNAVKNRNVNPNKCKVNWLNTYETNLQKSESYVVHTKQKLKDLLQKPNIEKSGKGSKSILKDMELGGNVLSKERKKALKDILKLVPHEVNDF